MRDTTYTDETGRLWAVQLPDGVPDSEAARGLVVGPPEINADAFEIPEETAVRLHNELFHRGLIRLRDVQRHPSEVASAIRAAYRIDVQRVMALYAEEGVILAQMTEDAAPEDTDGQ